MGRGCVLWVLAGLLSACPTPTPAPDAGPDDGGVVNDGGMDGGVDEDGGVVGPHGFVYRIPQQREVPCEGDFFCADDTTTAWDTDYVCQFAAGDDDVVLYTQGTPTAYLDFEGYRFETQAWLNDGDVVEAIDADYDWGGNHHNDFITVDVGALTYRLYHASFGFGFRACQPPNCVQVYDGDALVEDGCQTDRTLPAICKAVDDNGDVEDLVDTYERCPGDEN